MYRIYALMLASLVMLSAGCATDTFGVSEKEWEQLTPEQKNLVIKGYNRRQRLEIEGENQRRQKEAETAPFRDAIRALQSNLRHHDKKH